MIALLRTRRWLGFTAVVILAILAFGLLSLWQWHRAEDKRAQRIELQEAMAVAPVALDAVVVDGTVPADGEWRHVELAGTYQVASQVLVRKRPLDGTNGFWVMTPLRTTNGTTVWVNRGWVPTAGDALSTPNVEPPPAGTVAVTGFLRQFEQADASANNGLPAGQIAAPAEALLPDAGGAITGYVQLQTSAPEDVPTALPPPEVDEARNISYAVQWLIFALVAMGGWFFFLRREAREDAQAVEKNTEQEATL